MKNKEQMIQLFKECKSIFQKELPILKQIAVRSNTTERVIRKNNQEYPLQMYYAEMNTKPDIKKLVAVLLKTDKCNSDHEFHYINDTDGDMFYMYREDGTDEYRFFICGAFVPKSTKSPNKAL